MTSNARTQGQKSVPWNMLLFVATEISNVLFLHVTIMQPMEMPVVHVLTHQLSDTQREHVCVVHTDIKERDYGWSIKAAL